MKWKGTVTESEDLRDCQPPEKKEPVAINNELEQIRKWLLPLFIATGILAIGTRACLTCQNNIQSKIQNATPVPKTEPLSRNK